MISCIFTPSSEGLAEGNVLKHLFRILQVQTAPKLFYRGFIRQVFTDASSAPAHTGERGGGSRGDIVEQSSQVEICLTIL